MSSSEEPYGEIVSTTLRAVTWNVWGKFGPWRERQTALEQNLSAASPDLVLLQESWSDVDGVDQASLLGERLGLAHHHATSPAPLFGDWGPVNAIISRWPLRDVEEHMLPAVDDGWGGLVLRAVIEGPRGDLDAYCVALDWPPQASRRRSHAVALLAQLIAECQTTARRPLLVAGDFNATPDSDEIRTLTGRRPPPVDGFVLFDAWESGASGAGATWTRSNPWAAPTLLPDRRIDYVFTGWPRRGGVGSVVAAELIGDQPVAGTVASDHYGILTTIRY